MKKCNKCNNEYEETEFSKNSNTCKSCVRKYHKEYYENKRKHKKKTYRNLITKLKNKGFKYGEIDKEKVDNLVWDMIDFPEQPYLQHSLSHANFMRKYDLCISEYIYIRKRVRDNKFYIENKYFFVMIF